MTEKKTRYTSFKEYKNRYFPDKNEQQVFIDDDPFVFGASLARKALSKIEKELAKT